MFNRTGATAALQLFAAQTLRSKTARQLTQLPQSRWPWLRDQTVLMAEHGSSNPLLQRYLCLTLVALIVQWEDWKDPLPFLRECCSGCMLPASTNCTTAVAR